MNGVGLRLGLLGMSIIAVCVGGETVRAQEESKDGPSVQVGFDPGLNINAAWHSNPYYRDRDGAAAGMIFSVDPTLSLGYPINELLFFGLAGKLNIAHVMFIDDTPEKDKTVLQPYIEAKLRYNPSENTSLALRDEFQIANVEDDWSGDKFYINNAGVELRRDFGGSIRGSIRYNNTVISQEDSSVLFDSKGNTVGAEAGFKIAPTDTGRPVYIGLAGDFGRKEFDDGSFFGQSSTKNPKTHDHYSFGLKSTYPVSSLLTIDATAGMQFRDYEVHGGGRSSSTESPYGGLTFTFVPTPGSPLSFTFANSYQLEDTVVYDIPEYNRAVFDTTDALLNNLDLSYRQLETWRSGLALDYRINPAWLAKLSTTYQNTRGDETDDLSPISGNIDPAESGIGTATDVDEVVIALVFEVRPTDNLTLGLGYQHGYARDSRAGAKKDVYEYDSIGVLMKLALF